MSLCRSLLKEFEIFSFVRRVLFLCACVDPIPVRGLHILITIFIQFNFYLFIPYRATHALKTDFLSPKRKPCSLQLYPWYRMDLLYLGCWQVAHVFAQVSDLVGQNVSSASRNLYWKTPTTNINFINPPKND